MVKINENLLELENGNGFSNVNSKVAMFKKNNPDINLISLGVGDVSKPVVQPITDAMHKAVYELGNMKTFHGYGEYYGNEVLKKTILVDEYAKFGFNINEIYISNGAKSDTSNILELFDINSKIFITDPGYTVYRDGALCLDRKNSSVLLSEDTNFLPQVPEEKYDIIYLCSPNNPIGNAYTYELLEEWVQYALENNAVILYDTVYSPFITSKNVPKSIYEIKDADKVAIEFRSFSKVASFTGLRCSYYIIPDNIFPNINEIWKKRTMNRTNGVDYIVQMGALESFSLESKKLIMQNIKSYLKNAKRLKKTYESLGYKVWGGVDSPFMWLKIKDNMTSWECFEYMLNELNIITIPGPVFGEYGEGYFRVSALGDDLIVDEAIRRLKNEK